MKTKQRLFAMTFAIILFLCFLFPKTVIAQSSIFTTQVPSGVDSDHVYELGTKFMSSTDAVITAIRYYKPVGETGFHIGRIWTEGGVQIGEGWFFDETASGWQTAVVSTPVNLSSNTIYIVSVNVNVSYVFESGGLASVISNDFLSTISDGNNGVFDLTPGNFPTQSFNNTNYFRDIIAEEVKTRTIFTNQVPANTAIDNVSYELGVKFISAQEAIISAIRYFKTSNETGLHTGRLWTADGTQLAEAAFIGESSYGWQTAVLSTPVTISANTIYVASVNANIEYPYEHQGLASVITHDFLSTVGDGNNGVFNSAPGNFPNQSYNNSNYFRDIVAEIEIPHTPVLISPANSAVNISIEPQLQWSSVSNADNYFLQVSDDNSFGNLIVNLSGLTSTTYDLSGLSNSTQYYWRVAANNFAGNGEFASASFTTFEAKTPMLSWPIGGASLGTQPPTLSWYLNSSGIGISYDLLYATNSGLNTPTIVPNINATSFILEGLLPGTKYYWQVRSKTAGGDIISYSNIESFISAGVAFKPIASWPSGGTTVYTYTQSLYWYLNNSSLGLSYEVEFREGGVGALLGQPTHIDIGSTSLEITSLSGGTQYSWQVRSKSGSNYSAWSEPVSFFTIAGNNGLIIPTPSWPVDNAVVYQSSPSLNWYLGADGTGLTYEIEFVSGGPGNLTGTFTYGNINSLTYQLSNLVGGNTYSWSVRSKLGSEYSDWSPPETFTVVSYVNTPVVPTPSWPVAGAQVYSPITTLNWYLGSFTANLTFEVELRNGALTGVATDLNIMSTSYEISGLIGGETYTWSVRSTDGLNFSNWTTPETFVVNSSTGTAAIPNLSWPIGLATVYTVNPSLYWFLNSYSIGLEYTLKYSINSDMSDPIVIPNIQVLNYTLSGLSQGTVYYWQVQSFDGNVYSAYSAIGSFVVFTQYAPAVPSLGSPVGSIALNTISPTMTWFLPTISTVSSYELEYSTNLN
ncbi:MAG: DUF4082 domain-containing protein, partial [Ignavibacteriaceae bacterium]|nr:DUF4082 domain-containing protein [Ignavibacteriaceae bacterium]